MESKQFEIGFRRGFTKGVILTAVVAAMGIMFGWLTPVDAEALQNTPHAKMMMIKSRHEILADVPMTVKTDPGVVLTTNDGRLAAGVYDARARKVFVLNSAWYRMEHAMLHEAGHLIWFERLTQAQRDQYAAAWQHEQFSPSEYGRQSVAENWAETFAFVYGSRHRMFSGVELDTRNSQQQRLVFKFTGK